MAPPIYVKGGVWTNVEDQILKAAVSKYGLTQWARVASLLPKKTAKQAKARWNEYLNPNINRTSWTSEDDDKLLSLAKLLPNQWRSISSIIGRTATHCVERYQKLLENAAKFNEYDSGTESEDDNINDMKMTGPGIESLPALGNAYESLPSRPDAENMEDDDREMLSEAKARLANTQGKKAKRKDRERMLEESRRVSLMQKRRELKAAGINISLTSKNRSRRKEFDYNADIPHERIPKPGLYDVSAEDKQNEELRIKFEKEVSFKGVSTKEGLNKAAKSLKKAAEADSKRIKANTRQAAEAVTDLESSHFAKRRKLELPPPGTESKSDVLKQQILAKSKDLLSAQRNANEGEIHDESTTPQPISINKVSRKKIASTLRTLLAKLPPPKESTQVILPQFETEISLDSIAVEHPVSLQQSDYDKQFEFDQAHARRSRMLLKGLAVPNFDSIVIPIAEDGSITEKIKLELKALIEFDMLMDEDSSNTNVRLPPIEENLLARTEKQIEKEVEKIPHNDHYTIDASYKAVLPSSEEAITKVHDLLHSLNASSNEADQRSAIMEDRRANELVYEKLRTRVLENSRKLLEADLEEKVLLDIMWTERLLIERRSISLHEKVEDIKLAESRAARVL